MVFFNIKIAEKFAIFFRICHKSFSTGCDINIRGSNRLSNKGFLGFLSMQRANTGQGFPVYRGHD